MSSSPPPTNVLIDPSEELRSALLAHSFGLDPASSLIRESVYPGTDKEVATIASESRRTGSTSARVVGRARLIFLANEGEAVVVLDYRGYTLESLRLTESQKLLPNKTYESLDGLLIAVSPAYVEAMSREVLRRFDNSS